MSGTNKKRFVYCSVLSGILTIMQIVGLKASIFTGSSFYSQTFLKRVDSSPLLLGVYAIIIFLFLFLFSFLAFSISSIFEIGTKSLSRRAFVFLTIGLIAIYAFWIFAVYPGFYNYDGGNQFIMVMYEEVPYSEHHPLLSTLVIGSLVTLGYKLRPVDLSFGFFLYTSFQTILAIGSFSYALRFLYKKTKNTLLTIIGFCIFAFHPTIVMFTLSSTKDVLCFCFLMVGGFCLYDVIGDYSSNKEVDKKTIASTIIFLSLSTLYRKNIIYAFVVFSAISLFLVKRQVIKLMLIYLSVILIYFFVGRGLSAILNAEPDCLDEAICVPYQQIAYLYEVRGESAFSDQELDLIYEVITPEMLGYYDPTFADPIKAAFSVKFDNIERNLNTYAKLWIKKFFQYPMEYINAFVLNSYQGWYPATINICETGCRYFDHYDWREELGQVGLDSAYSFVDRVEAGEYKEWYVIRYLFTAGTMLIFTMTVLFIAIYNENKASIAVLLLILLVCATNLLGPVADVRYNLILFYILPILPAFCLKKELD